MGTTVSLNGANYTIPAVGESGWGTSLSAYLVALSTGVLQKAGGAFTLTAEVDFGATYGLKSAYLKSRGTNVASAGVMRLANLEAINWRNAANNADIGLSVNASDALTFGGNPLLNLALGAADTGLHMNAGGTGYVWSKLANANVDAAAAIAYSKLNLASSLVNADVANAAAIAYSKLALTGTLVNADVSGTAAIAYSKLNLASSLVNADVASGAAIAYSKLALTGSLVNADVSGSAAIAYSKLNLASSLVNADVASGAAIAYSKLNLSGAIVNADVSGSAAIAPTKLAAGTFPSGSTFPGGTVSDYLAFTHQSSDPSAPSGSDVRLYVKNKKVYKATASGNSELGASGTSGKNYLQDYFDLDSGYGTTVTLAGATANRSANQSQWRLADAGITLTTTTVSGEVLRGTTSGKIVFPAAAANAFVESPMFTLDRADLGATLTNAIDWDVGASGYAAADLKVEIIRYNSSGTYQETIACDSSNSPTGRTAGWLTRWASQSTITDLYALRITNTSASARTIYNDSYQVGPQRIIYQTPQSNEASYTPTITSGFGTCANIDFKWSQDGQYAYIRGVFQAGTVAATNVYFTLPNSKTIDTTLVAGTSRGRLGRFEITGGTTALISSGDREGVLFYDGTNADRVYFTIRTTTTGYEANVGSAIAASNSWVMIEAKIPISGWSSNQQMAESNILFGSHDGTSAASGMAGATMLTTTPAGIAEEFNITSLFPNVQPTDKFEIEIQRAGTGPWVPPGTEYMDKFRFDGTNYIGAGVEYDGTNIRLLRGKYRLGTTTTWAGIPAGTKWRVVRSSGIAVASLPKKPMARYSANASTSNVSIANAAEEIVDYNSKAFDTHGAVTTGVSWKFTAPVAGYYRVSTLVFFDANVALGDGEYVYLMLNKNNANYAVIARTDVHSSVSAVLTIAGSDVILLNAGDYIDIRVAQGSGSALNLLVSGTLYNHIAIECTELT